MFASLAGSIEGRLSEEDQHRTAAELSSRSRLEQMADAQVLLLRAIYNELRHGHDQTARDDAAIGKQTAAIADLAFQLEKVARHLGDR